jgi:hypothetical protein
MFCGPAHKATSALTLCVLLLAGCGQGSGTVAPLSGSGSSSSATANATLTIVFPTNFRHLGAPGTASAHRTPAYVNPSSGNTISVYGVPTTGSIFTLTNTVAVNAAAGATSQTIAIQLPAISYIEVVVQEKNATGTVLAQGSTPSPNIMAGGTIALSVTMDMVAAGIAMTTDPVNGADAVLLSNSSGSPTPICAKNAGQVYTYPVDASQGYLISTTSSGGTVDQGGHPAVPVPTLVSQTASDSSVLSASSFGYKATYAQPTSTIAATFSVSNANVPTTNVTASGLVPTVNAYASIDNVGTAICPNASWSPASVTVGSTSTLTITGGTAPYTVTSPGGTCPTASGSANTYTATPSTAGTCTYTVTDAKGRIVTAALTATAISNLYFANANYGLAVCDETGAAVASSGFSGIVYANAAAFDSVDNDIFVGDISGGGTYTIRRYGLDGTSLGTFATVASSVGPEALAYNPANQHLYAAILQSYGGGPDLLEWDSTGAQISNAGRWSGTNGATAVAVDATNQHIYVLDSNGTSNGGTIRVFTPNGGIYSTSGSFILAPTTAIGPESALFVDPAANRVYLSILDSANSMVVVQIFDLQGNTIATSGSFSGLTGSIIYDPHTQHIFGLQQISTMYHLLGWDSSGNAISLGSTSCFTASAYQGFAAP